MTEVDTTTIFEEQIDLAADELSVSKYYHQSYFIVSKKLFFNFLVAWAVF